MRKNTARTRLQENVAVRTQLFLIISKGKFLPMSYWKIFLDETSCKSCEYMPELICLLFNLKRTKVTLPKKNIAGLHLTIFFVFYFAMAAVNVGLRGKTTGRGFRKKMTGHI